MKYIITIAAFLAGICLTMLFGPVQRPVKAMPTTPTITFTPMAARTPTPGNEPTMASTLAPTATIIPAHIANSTVLGWGAEVACINCVPVKKHVQVHHYDPRAGKFNCFTWNETLNWCMSPTSSGIDWQAVWGIAAACPQEWGIGPWIELPFGNFICLDHGDMIFCEPDGSLCTIDILGPGGAAWDGHEFDATLWIPVKPKN